MSATFAKWSLVVVKIMAALLLAIMSWRLWHAGGTAERFGETTQQLLISFGPFYYLLSVSILIYAVVVLLDIWQLLRSGAIIKLTIAEDEL